MARIGFKPVVLPAGVTAEVKEGAIAVKGPKGELSVSFPKEFVSVEVNGSERYFYRIFQKEMKEEPSAEALVAFEDFEEIQKVFEAMVAEELKERSQRKDYFENCYRTSDGFQIGYRTKNRQTEWFIVIDRYSEKRVMFDGNSRLRENLQKAKAKFEEVKKQRGN